MDDPPVKRHSFTQGLIMWGLRFLRVSWASFRLTAGLLKELALNEKIQQAPTAETLIQWELKLGFYKLERAKSTQDEWVWIADHVVRLGSHKCFVVVGVRVNQMRQRGNLTVSLADLEPMGIIPMQQSNGEEVFQQLQGVRLKTGVTPTSLVIDHGSDLYCGCKKFSNGPADVRLQYDVCHKISCEFKKRLKTDSWDKMTSAATASKKALSMGPYQRFAPPSQRSKARYMNLDGLVDWGYQALRNADALPQKVHQEISWLHDLRDEIHLWKEWITIGQLARDVIRVEGFYEGVEELFMDRVIDAKLSSSSNELVESLVDYMEEEGEGLSYDRRQIGSTESLEGLFGGYKRIYGDNKSSVNALGRLILCMGSRLGECSEELVNEALTQVRCSDVNNWLDRAFVANERSLEEKWEHLKEGNVCNF